MSAVVEQEELDGIAGKCVLVVEDDYVLAREVCNDLKRHGANILGPAPTVHYASLIMGKRQVDGAILDIKLFGEEVYELVDTLMERGVPIVFATAYQPDQIDAKYSRFDVMTKPLDYSTLRRKVANFRPMAPEPHSSVLARPSTSIPSMRGTTEASEPDRWARLLLAAMQEKI